MLTLIQGPKVVFLTVVCTIILIIILLTIHSCTLRPFYTETSEFDVQDEYGEMWVIDGPVQRDTGDVQLRGDKLPAHKEDWEECKLVFLCMLVISSVGCCISMTCGGAFVFRTWTARSASDCSVANLGDLWQDGYAKFSCKDGYVDFDHQLTTIQRENEVQGSTYTTYNMAPVYQDPDDKVPVAWAVAKNEHLDSGFQARLPVHAGDGLCGIMVNTQPADRMCKGLYCASEQDQRSFSELKHAFVKHFNAEGSRHSHGEQDTDSKESAFDVHALPTVELTNLANPEGKIRHFVYSVFLYVVTLLGLIGMQLDYAKEARSRPPSGASVETRYEALQPQ